MIRMYFLVAFFLITELCLGQWHWETIVAAETEWKYFAATTEPSEYWNTLQFDDTQWLTGIGGIGYDDGDDATVIEFVNSLYLRVKFGISDLALITEMLLDIDFDDGFVAYINGTEIARSANVIADNPAFDSGVSYDREALMYQGGAPERYALDKSVLLTGENVLAVHILNISFTSSDLSSLVYLQGKINSENISYSQTPEWFVAPSEFSDSNLPIVIINTNGQTIVDDPKITATMGIINNGVGNRNAITDDYTDYNGLIGIEVRGQSSQMFPKKSYGFETRDQSGADIKVPLMGMPAESDWVLYAPFTDKTMVRNALTFELCREMGNYCTRTQYCELFLNGVYEGIYILMEKIKRDEFRVNINKLKPDETSGDDLTGGYIVKVDKLDWNYQNGYDGWLSAPEPSYPEAKDITFQYYYPKPEDLVPAQRNYIKNFVTETEAVLISEDFTDKNTGYNKYLNVGSFVDALIINEISKEVDKYRFSTYFYKQRDSDGGEFFAGPAWDFNLGYGNVDYWNFGLSADGWVYEDVQPGEWSVMYWWKRLVEDPYFASLVATRWHDLRQNVLSNENQLGIIDSLVTIIDEAKERNFDRWPILGVYIWPNYDWEGNDYSDELDYLRNWLTARLAWMDYRMSNIERLTPIAHLSGNAGTELVYNIELTDDYFNHKINFPELFQLNCESTDFSISNVEINSASEATVYITAASASPDLSQEFSITIDKSLLNSFADLTSNTLTFDPTVNIGSDKQLRDLKIYSYQDGIHVKYLNQNLLPAQLRVINTFGQTVETKMLRNQGESIVKANVSNGIYLVQIVTETYTKSEVLYLY